MPRSVKVDFSHLRNFHAIHVYMICAPIIHWWAELLPKVEANLWHWVVMIIFNFIPDIMFAVAMSQLELRVSFRAYRQGSPAPLTKLILYLVSASVPKLEDKNHQILWSSLIYGPTDMSILRAMNQDMYSWLEEPPTCIYKLSRFVVSALLYQKWLAEHQVKETQNASLKFPKKMVFGIKFAGLSCLVFCSCLTFLISSCPFGVYGSVLVLKLMSCFASWLNLWLKKEKPNELKLWDLH